MQPQSLPGLAGSLPRKYMRECCFSEARSSDSPAFQASWMSWLLTSDGGLVRAKHGLHSDTAPLFLGAFPPTPPQARRRNS